MIKITGLSIFILLFCASGFAFDENDFQYWNTESVSWKINDKYKTSFEAEFRYGDDASNFYYQHTDLGITYSGLTKWLDVGLNYRLILEEKKTIFRYENVPHLNATLKGEVFDFAVSNRSRIEYKEREEAEDYWRYRNKTTLKLPLKLTKLEIQPYVADEIFYDFNVESLNRNRLYSGIGFKVLKNLSAEIYYLWQSSKSNDNWSDTHALGTKLKLSF